MTPPRISRDELILELLLDGSAEDTSGGGRHGVVHGAVPTADRFGRADGAYLLNGPSTPLRAGAGDHIVISPPPPLNAHALTLSVWMRVDTHRMSGWSQCFVSQDNGDDVDQSRRIFQLSAFDGIVVWHRMQRAADPAAKQFIVPGAWFHVAAVVDRGVHRLYIDGALQDSVRDPCRVHPDEPLYIGRKGTDEPYFFVRGAIDEVRLFNRVLAPGEIRALADDAGPLNPETRWNAPPISDLWGQGDQGLLDLRFDGQSQVRGAIMSGQPGHIVPIERGAFDAATGTLTLGGRATLPDTGAEVDYTIEGRLSRRRLNVRYQFGDHRGHATARNINHGRAFRRMRRSAARTVERFLKPVLRPIIRWRRARLRPTKAENLRRLAARVETTAELVVRNAIANDHPCPCRAARKDVGRDVSSRPSPADAGAARAAVAGSVRQTGRLVVLRRDRSRRRGFEYQRLGLGRRLVGHVARRFLGDGVTTMTLSADEGNPSCRFYEALGAEHQRDADGRESGGAFIWKDLEALAKICPIG